MAAWWNGLSRVLKGLIIAGGSVISLLLLTVLILGSYRLATDSNESESGQLAVTVEAPPVTVQAPAVTVNPPNVTVRPNITVAEVVVTDGTTCDPPDPEDEPPAPEDGADPEPPVVDTGAGCDWDSNPGSHACISDLAARMAQLGIHIPPE